MNEFKSGDLVVIFGCRSNPSFNGLCAEIVEPIGFYEFAGMPEEPWYWISVGSYKGRARHGVLFPLRGDFAPERQKSREVTV